MSTLRFSSSSTLPIFNHKQRIIDMVRRNQVNVICADIGCGMTTQIPQYLLEAEVNNNLCIAVTQPWKIASISMAKRVSEELQCVCGMEVGFEVVSTNQSNASTKIKYMTDDLLLDRCLSDQTLSQYGVIMIDEAHERTVYSDLLMGILKNLITRRKDLKVLITSCNDGNEIFSKFFNAAPSLRIQRNSYQVSLLYEPIKRNDFISRSVNVVQKTMKKGNNGDYLIFLPSNAEIDSCVARLSEVANITVIKLNESMDSLDEIFMKIPANHRRVIVSNHIAETMITIPTVRYVVDCGLMEETIYDPDLDNYVSKKIKISRFRAKTRANKAGCNNKGFCYRVYRTGVYENMTDKNVSGIQKTDFTEFYMKLLALGFDPVSFDYLEKPSQKLFDKCRQKLQNLNLLDDSFHLTDTGENIKDIPLESVASKVVLSSSALNCSKEIVTIMALMSFNIFEYSPSPNFLIDTCHRAFFDDLGDHFTRFNAYNEFLRNGRTKKWCYLNYLNHDALLETEKLKNKLEEIMESKKGKLNSMTSEDNKSEIVRTLIREYYRNICVKHEEGGYINFGTKKLLRMDPNSCLFKESPKIVLFHECRQVDGVFVMNGILKINESWLEDFPVEMTKINYQPGFIPEYKIINNRRYDPFEGDNDPVYVYQSPIYDYYESDGCEMYGD